MCGYLLIKNAFVTSNGLLIEKYGLVIWLDHHKMKKIILIHIPNLLFGFNIW
jgi:hypothetical protein